MLKLLFLICSVIFVHNNSVNSENSKAANVNDSSTVTREEFERLTAEFQTLKLETQKIMEDQVEINKMFAELAQNSTRLIVTTNSMALSLIATIDDVNQIKLNLERNKQQSSIHINQNATNAVNNTSSGSI